MDPISKANRAAYLLRTLVILDTIILMISIAVGVISSADLPKDDRPLAIAATLGAALTLGLLLAGLYAIAALLDLQAHRTQEPSIPPPPR